MKHLALASSALVLLLSLLFWLRDPNRPGNSVYRQHLIPIGASPQPVRPTTWPSIPGLQKRIPAVDLRDVPLEDAIDRLRAATGLNIVVQWNSLEKLGLDRKTPITLKLRDASAIPVARAMLQSRFITQERAICLVDENIVIFTAGMDSTDFAETRVYDARDIILDAIAFHSRLPANAPEANTASGTNAAFGKSIASCDAEESVVVSLREAVKHIGRESWEDNGGKPGVITYFAGHFVITATPEIHDEIGRLLAELRKGK